MQLITESRLTVLKRAVFVLLIGAMLVRVCNAALYLPIGGPNVFLMGLVAAAMLSSVYVLLCFLQSRNISTLLGEYVPVIPILAVSSLLLVWAAAVYLLTDTLSLARLMHMTLGIGALFAVFVSVDSVFRAVVLVCAIVIAVFVSTMFGLAMAVYGDPFVTIWAVLGNIQIEYMPIVLTARRIAGLSSNTIAFSYVLAVAIPLTLAALIHGIRFRSRWRSLAYESALYIVLMLMVTAMFINASRSVIAGVVLSAAAMAALFCTSRQECWRRLAVVVPLIAVWLIVFFHPAFSVSGLIVPDGHRELLAPGEEANYDTWWLRLLVSEAKMGPDGDGLRERIGAARLAWNMSGTGFALDSRIVNLGDRSAQARIPMAVTAIRYSLDHPLGTGRYMPEMSHLPAGLDTQMIEHILTSAPHNQFLVVLVYYGFPGLALLVTFYLFTMRSLLRAAGPILRSRDAKSLVLTVGVMGALAAYGVNSLFHNAGPFVGDWYHFYLVGLVFSLQRIAASGQEPRKPDGVDRFLELHWLRGLERFRARTS